MVIYESGEIGIGVLKVKKKVVLKVGYDEGK